MTNGRVPKDVKVPVSFRFGEAAKAKLEALAAAEGITPRSFLEKRVLELDQPHIVARVKEHPDLRALLFQVNKTGNNINQIAHRFNLLEMTGRLSRDEALLGLNRLELISARLTEALRRAR